MHRIIASLLLFCATSLVALRPSSAITIDTVPVGNPGNASDPSDGDAAMPLIQHLGAVAYLYRIGTCEVTVGQYTTFLNAVAATDTYDLYNIQMASMVRIAGISQTGTSGNHHYSVIGSPNKPVTFVSWGDAARFCNWLQNGQPGLDGPGVPQDAASTEDGAYPLFGANIINPLHEISRSPEATWFIPNENEWYKAAYHHPAAQGGDVDDYWAYPTRTNSEPNSDQPPADANVQTNVANFYRDDLLDNGFNDGYAVSGLPDDPDNTLSGTVLTDVGAYTYAPSPYGTFDQGGNVWEWNETRIGNTKRVLRGGAWDSSSDRMLPSDREDGGPPVDYPNVGFRVARVPEPGSFALAALASLALVVRRKRASVASH